MKLAKELPDGHSGQNPVSENLKAPARRSGHRPDGHETKEEDRGRGGPGSTGTHREASGSHGCRHGEDGPTYPIDP